MSKLHYIIVLIVVLVIATLTYQLSTSVDETIETADPNLRHDPDYFISEFKATMYDPTGKANYRLTAEHLEHFPDNDTVEVKMLKLEYIDPSQQLWRVTAEHAIGYENSEILDMSTNVRIVREATNPEQNLVLTTDKIRVDIPNKLATTDARVKIVGKNSNINATGMDINLKKGTLTLRSQAQGQYVPK